MAHPWRVDPPSGTFCSSGPREIAKWNLLRAEIPVYRRDLEKTVLSTRANMLVPYRCHVVVTIIYIVRTLEVVTSQNGIIKLLP